MAVERGLTRDGQPPGFTADHIIEAVSTYFGVSIDDLRGHARAELPVKARLLAIYLCCELTDLSLHSIGLAFGGRDRRTVMNLDRKIRQRVVEDRTLFYEVAELLTG